MPPAGRARPGSAGPPGAPVYSGKKKLRPRWGRIALVVAIVLLACGGLGIGALLVRAKQIDDSVGRTDPFSRIASRPPKTVDGALNILMLGSDSRDPGAPVDQASKWRTDTIALMHIPANHDKAYIIALPRDLWVHVPKSQTSPYGGTMAKINAAYAWGGQPLMVQTVEEYTGVRIDHVVEVDFGGFVKVTDALGGVDLYVEKDIVSIHPPHRHFTKGMHHMNGAEALDYVRQRKQFPDGDFARIRHQQQFLKAILSKATSTGTIANPAKLNAFLSSVAGAIKVDKSLSLLDMAWQFRNLRSSDLVFMTSPNNGSAMINGESVVVSDKEKALSLYDAVAKDTVASWLASNSPSSQPGN